MMKKKKRDSRLGTSNLIRLNYMKLIIGENS